MLQGVAISGKGSELQIFIPDDFTSSEKFHQVHIHYQALDHILLCGEAHISVYSVIHSNMFLRSYDM